MNQKEIWLVNLDPTLGSEMKKTRPSVILNDDSIGVLPLKIIAPITDFKITYKEVPWMVIIHPDKLNNLKKDSVIDLFQIRSVSEERLIKKLGSISEKNLEEAKYALKVVFDID
ncbi:MAG: type II toxin-antitoxin system PemK/MazF family toxin [Candidatus Sericytochromatia bacterium]|nr:type II toxin-antitoxin system PemK/MazF family toxin [Candidatus Sericytochromatia bacterium]